jgi:hypothetical protein
VGLILISNIESEGLIHTIHIHIHIHIHTCGQRVVRDGLTHPGHDDVSCEDHKGEEDRGACMCVYVCMCVCVCVWCVRACEGIPGMEVCQSVWECVCECVCECVYLPQRCR